MKTRDYDIKDKKRVKEYRDPYETEFMKNMERVKEREKKMEKIKKWVKISITSLSAAAILAYAAKTLKAEDIITSTSTEKSFSTPTITNSSFQFTSLISLNEEKCNLSKISIDVFNERSRDVYICLTSKNEEDVLNALDILLKENVKIDKNIISQLNNLVLDSEWIIYKQALEVIKKKKADEAVSSILKRVEAGNVDPMWRESIDTLGVFAVRGNWNAINGLLKILKENPDPYIQANAAAVLLFVNKNVMPDILNFYRNASVEAREELAKRATTFGVFELDMENNPYNKGVVKNRLNQLVRIEKDNDVKELFDSIYIKD